MAIITVTNESVQNRWEIMENVNSKTNYFKIAQTNHLRRIKIRNLHSDAFGDFLAVEFPLL